MDQTVERATELLGRLEARVLRDVPVSIEFVIYNGVLTYRVNLKYLGQDHYFIYRLSIESLSTDTLQSLTNNLVYDINKQAPLELFK